MHLNLVIRDFAIKTLLKERFRLMAVKRGIGTIDSFYGFSHYGSTLGRKTRWICFLGFYFSKTIFGATFM